MRLITQRSQVYSLFQIQIQRHGACACTHTDCYVYIDCYVCNQSYRLLCVQAPSATGCTYRLLYLNTTTIFCYISIVQQSICALLYLNATPIYIYMLAHIQIVLLYKQSICICVLAHIQMCASIQHIDIDCLYLYAITIYIYMLYMLYACTHLYLYAITIYIQHISIQHIDVCLHIAYRYRLLQHTDIDCYVSYIQIQWHGACASVCMRYNNLYLYTTTICINLYDITIYSLYQSTCYNVSTYMHEI